MKQHESQENAFSHIQVYIYIFIFAMNMIRNQNEKKENDEKIVETYWKTNTDWLNNPTIVDWSINESLF